MAVETFIAGAYTSTYNSVGTGITADGYTLDQQSSAEMIDDTDVYGQSAIDAIYRGGNCFITFTSNAYKAGSITPFWPWGALGVMSTTSAPIGRLATDVASAHVLTSTANTPAAAAPASLTASEAILAPNNNASLVFSSKLRQVPVRLQYFPYVDSTTIRWFAIT